MIHQEKTSASPLTIVVAVVSSSLILLRDVSGLPIPKAVFIVLFALAFVILKAGDIYCLLAFITPLAAGISYTFLSAIALIAILLKRKISCDFGAIVYIICIFLIELCSAFQGDFSIVEYLRFASVFCVAFLFAIDKEPGENYESIIKFFLFGLIVALIDIWGQMLSVYSFREILSLSIRFGNTRKALNEENMEGLLVHFNQNALGTFCNISMLLCLIMYKQSGKKGYLLLALIVVLQGVMTGSRTFVLVCALFILTVLVASATDFRTAVKNGLLYLAFGVLVILAIKFAVPTYWGNLVKRFSEVDVSGGRFRLLREYFTLWWNSSPYRLLFGSGLQNYVTKYHMYQSCHCSIQEIIITWGIVGFFFVIVLFISIFHDAKRKNPRIQKIQYLPMLCLITSSLSGQGFSIGSQTLLIMVAYSIMMINLCDEHTVSIS